MARAKSLLRTVGRARGSASLSTDDAVVCLSALAQQNRLETFRLLVRAGDAGLPAGDIADALDIPPATLSFHVKALKQAGLLASERDGRQIRYAVDYRRTEQLLRYLAEDCCGGCCGVMKI